MKHLLLITILLALGLVSKAWSNDEDDDSSLLGDDFKIVASGEVNTRTKVQAQNGKGQFDIKDSYISLELNWQEMIRAVVTTKLEHLLKENGTLFNDRFDIREFIQEAYIEIRNIGGIPVALIVGKQPIPFGNNLSDLPFYTENPLDSLNRIEEVYGITLDLYEGFFGHIDRLQVSVFETNAGDLSIGKIDGVSVRISKEITDNWLINLSHAEMANSHLRSGHERRTALGLIGRTSDGKLKAWIEGIFFQNNPLYPNANVAISLGALYRPHPSAEVMIEYSLVYRELHEIVLGAKYYPPTVPGLSIGAEVRHRLYIEENRENETFFGLSVSYTFRFSSKTEENSPLIITGEKEEFDDEDDS